MIYGANTAFPHVRNEEPKESVETSEELKEILLDVEEILEEEEIHQENTPHHHEDKHKKRKV